MIVIIILGAVALALFMSVVTTYVDTQTDINQAKENAQAHTYHIASVVKSKDETFINTAEGVQFVIDPSDSECDLYWFEHSNKLGNVSSARVHKLFNTENGDVHFDSETMEAYKQSRNSQNDWTYRKSANTRRKK